MDAMRSGTAAGLLAFLKWMQEKGLAKAATVNARRSAAQKVLEIDGEGWLETDIRTLDIEEQFQRFAHLLGSNYTPGSLTTYGQRFRDAVELYLEYLANPTGFRAPPSRSSKAAKPKAVRSAKQEHGARGDVSTSAERPSSTRDLITYPFPLHDGELAYVQLPVRVGSADAERLCAFIRSIAIASEG